MGLSNFPSPAEGGVLSLLVMNSTVMLVAFVKKKLRSVLRVAGDQDSDDEYSGDSMARRVSFMRYGLLCRNRRNICVTRGRGGVGVGGSGDWTPAVECCVCLCRFEGDEEVSELCCKHFFHRGCLDKWFDNQHITCPLCRSIT